MISRNSRMYRRLSKLISPFTKLFHQTHTADSEFSTVPIKLDSACIESHWRGCQLELVSKTFTDSGLVLKCLRESVWYQNLQGPMLYRYIAGDGVVSMTVRTRKASDTTSYPDTQWQFGGIMFRDPASGSWLSSESYVFNVVGYRHDALQIENKSTHNGYSEVSAVDWDTGDAKLLIERRGPIFTLKAMPIGATEWLDLCQYNRPDFPDVLQLAIIVYSYSEGREIVDLQTEFSDFKYQF